MKHFRTLLALAATALLSACILVDDFGPAWEQASPDPCLTKIAESLYYAEFNRDPSAIDKAQIMRGWSWQKQNYLLLKKSPTDKGGRLYRFRVNNGIFERFRLAPTKRAEFKHDYPNAPVRIERDTVTIPTLDAQSKDLLAEISKKPDYWEVEDKILYNTNLNPTCRFEDRDLKTLK